jgi:hypothetical protein
LNYFFFGVGIILLTGCQSKTADENFFNYSFKTAKISYDIIGSSTGTTEVWIKGPNKKIINQITATKADGSTRKYNNSFITNNGKTYSLNTDDKTGIMVMDSFYQELEKLPLEKRQEKLLQEALSSNVGADGVSQLPKPLRTETIAGQECQVYEINLKEVCMWQGIPLKTVTKAEDLGVDVQSVAKSILLDQGVSDSDFQVPTDYQITNYN